MAGGSAAAGRSAVLCVPHHGGHRLHHAVRRGGGSGAALARAAVGFRLVPAAGRGGGAARLRRGRRRLDHDRGRPPAVDRVRAAAHGGFRLAVAPRPGSGVLARALCRRLSDHVPDRHRLHGRAGATRPAAGGAAVRGHRSRPAEPSVRACGAHGRGDVTESPMVLDLVPIWTILLGLAVFYYVVFDGFDLGVGILYGLAPNDRALLMSSVAPVWDGNETWLVFGGLGLLTAFPLAFAIIIPALYFPILVMLLALVFRGVAFEFRFRDAERKTFWDRGFWYGSTIAPLAQGIMLGAFIQGFKVEGRVFAGGVFDFLTPFSILTGIALVFGYALLGAGWLVLKTEGEIQERARRYGRICLGGVLIAILLVSVWTPLMSEQISRRC